MGLYDDVKGWLVDAMAGKLAIFGAIVETVDINRYERGLDVLVRLAEASADDETLTGQFRFFCDLLDEQVFAGDLDAETAGDPPIVETSVTIEARRLGTSAAALWEAVSNLLGQRGCDRAVLHLVQHYDLGQTIPSSAEAQVVAEWSLSWEGLGRERLAEIVDAVWEVMRRVDQEYPAPG